MKKLLLLLHFAFYISHSQAQNVGIGTTTPTNKLRVAGNILVSQQSSANTPPTTDQTKAMINDSPQSFTDADSTGRIFDPDDLIIIISIT